MKRRGAIALALATTVAAALASTAGAGSSTVRVSHVAGSSQAVSCRSTLKIALVSPLTGGAGFLGNEQLSWAKFAVKDVAPKLGLKIRMLTGDTPVEQGPAPAQSLAQKYVADQKVVAIIGPATSGAVVASSKTYDEAGLAQISPSATRASLTKGANREAAKSFFRVVPDDDIQGPGDAKFIVEKLKAKKVVILDFQEPYSQGLSAAVDKSLTAKGVETTRLSIANTVTDFSSFVTKVPNDADIVFFPTQKPADAQNFAQQLIEQGKKAKVFGSDGAYDPSQFKVPGSYVSLFAPEVGSIASVKSIVDGWKKDNPGTAINAFGVSAYGAVQVALNAIKLACNAGKGQIKDRRDVVRNVKKVKVKTWILGGSFRFSTKTNDPLNTPFFISQIQPNGSYKTVG